MAEAPPTLRPVRHRPNPEKRPQRMQREQAYPSGRVDCVLVRMVAFVRDVIRDVVDGDDAVEQYHHHEQQQKECEVVQKWITHNPSLKTPADSLKMSLLLAKPSRAIVYYLSEA